MLFKKQEFQRIWQFGDLAREINNRKKKYEKDINEKTIMQWESSKAYPELEMCYQLAYILEVNQ